MGRGGREICIHVADSLCCIVETNNNVKQSYSNKNSNIYLHKIIICSYHQLDEHEFEQAPGVGDGQESLKCCSPWGRRESDTTERLN